MNTAPPFVQGSPKSATGLRRPLAFLSEQLTWPTSLSSWLFAGSLTLSPLHDFSVAEHVSFGDVFFMLAVLTAFGERLFRREAIPVLPIYLAVMSALFVCYVVNHVGREDDQFSSFMVIFTMLALFPQAMLMLRISGQEEMKFMVYAWMVGGLISSFFVIGYCNGMFSSHLDWFWYWDHRARGLTPTPNRLGLNCYMTLPGLLLMISSSRTLFGKTVGLALIGVTLKALDYSGSRAGMVAALIVGGAWGLMQLWDSSKSGRVHRIQGANLVAWIGLLFLAFAGYCAATGNVPFLQGTFNRLLEGDGISDYGRSDLNKRAWAGFLDNPIFGEGYQWFGVFQPNVAHNIYLQYLNSVGLIGFVAFLIVIIYPLIYPIKKQFSIDNTEFRTLNMPLLAAAVALLAWLKPQSGFTNYEGLLVVGLLSYISVWRLYDPPNARD